MKKTIAFILIFLALIVAAWKCNAQTFGFAGSNTAQVLVPEVRAMITALPADQIAYCIREDKESPHSVQSSVDNIIALNNELIAVGKTLLPIYTVETRGRSIADNTFTYNQIKTKMFIPYVKLGNEEYFNAAGHHGSFDDYKIYFEPIVAWFTANGYTGKFLIPVSYNNTAWDDAVAAYITDKPNFGIDRHDYWNREDLAAYGQLDAKDMLPSELTTSNGYLPAKDNFYRDVYNQFVSSSKLTAYNSYYASKFPGRDQCITEVGPPGNVGNLQNTIGFNATQDWYANKIKGTPNVMAVCFFNGPCSTGTGDITPRGKLDPVTLDGYVERLAYFTLYQFMENMFATPISQINAPGEYVFSIHNLTRSAIDFEGYIPVADNLQITGISYEGITGQNYYSSAGACAWWATGSEKTYEVVGSQIYENGIPALSYGYIHCTVESVCYDTTYVVMDTVDITVTVDNFCPDKCGRLFYALFHSKACAGCGGTHTVTQQAIIPRNITTTICK